MRLTKTTAELIRYNFSSLLIHYWFLRLTSFQVLQKISKLVHLANDFYLIIEKSISLDVSHTLWGGGRWGHVSICVRLPITPFVFSLSLKLVKKKHTHFYMAFLKSLCCFLAEPLIAFAKQASRCLRNVRTSVVEYV